MARADRPHVRSRNLVRRSWVAGASAAVVVAAVAVGAFAYRVSGDLPGISLPDQGNRHLGSLDEPHEPYNSDPPTSGPHLSYLAPWGVHERPIPAQLQVHNLEDGGVLVQYGCECPELVARLRNLVERHDRYVILAPYPGMASPIALTAWTRMDTLDAFDERRITRFIEAYRGIDHHR